MPVYGSGAKRCYELLKIEKRRTVTNESGLERLEMDKSSYSTGSLAIMNASLLVAVELIHATRRLLADLGTPETDAQALGISNHLLEEVLRGKIPVNMEDVTHWIAHFAQRKNYPSLHGYLSSDAAGRVVSSLELLIRAG